VTYGYSYLAGTSMAAANVSGVIALMKAVNPALTPDELDELRVDGRITKDLGDSGRDDLYGYGLIDAQKAVLAAAPALLTVSPASLDFGTELSSADLIVDKIGSGPLAVLSVSDDAAWLSIQKDPAVGDVPARYSVQIDRTGLSPGDYGASISFESDNNTVIVSVTMKVATPPVLPTLLTVTPASFDFSVDLTDTVLTVDKNGADSITVQSVNIDADWLAIEEFNPGAGESGIFPTQYRVQVDRSGLAPGDYGATITLESENNTVAVSVIIQVAAAADVADGALYVQLIDPDSFEIVYRQTVNAEAGTYRFNFADVAAGRYLIFAGTDLDNDKFVGDAGEVNGAYLSLSQPVTLQVDQNMSGLDFDAGINLVLSAQSRQVSESGRRPAFIPAF
jgi:hypothetical protein